MKRISIAVVLAVAGASCGGSKPAPAPPPSGQSEAPAHGEAAGMGGMCPIDIPGTKVAVADTEDGVAISFTTTGDVAQLRDRVRSMAQMHEHMMMGSGSMGSGSTGSGSGMAMMKMVPSTARAEDIDGGARITLTPNDPAQLPQLRAHVREHGEQMASGHCPMMEHHG